MRLNRQQITLLAIFALFIAPLLLAFMLRSPWWDYQPDKLKNRGLLVQPPLMLTLPPTQGIDGKWLLLYRLPDPCNSACMDVIASLRQVHKAQGRRGIHLGVVILSRNTLQSDLRARLGSIYPQLIFISDTATTSLASLAQVNADLALASDAGNNAHVYIVDPLHNVILAYSGNSSPGDINADLKRLLKLSQ